MPALADEPASERMADCAGMMRVAADWVEGAEAAAILHRTADRWAEASVEQARVEGLHYPAFYAVSMQGEAEQEWQARGADAVESDEFHDWADRCRALDEQFALGIYVE